MPIAIAQRAEFHHKDATLPHPGWLDAPSSLARERGVAGTVNAKRRPPCRGAGIARGFYSLGRGSKDRGRVPAEARIKPDLMIERKPNVVLPFCNPIR